jgi:pilus assembly protein FimV
MLPEAGETTTPAIPENIPVQEQQQPELKPEVVQPEVTPAIVKPEPKPEVVKPAIKPAPKRVVESEDSDDNSYFAWLAGILALIGLLVGWVWRRKKIMEETISDESMFSSAFASSTHQGAEVSEISQMGSLPVSEDFSFQTGMVGENSILSEFTPSDFDAFETDQSEVDPISEADVYLAYGRYQQAEELMRKAIKDQPNRDECKLKLLEIFYANENTQEFENYANELTAQGKNEDAEFWGRVVEMGSEICPDLALFQGSSSSAEQTNASVFETVEETDSPAPTSDEAVESLSFATDSADTTDSNAVDFEAKGDDTQANDEVLESFDFDVDAEKAPESAAAEEDVEFDFDMSFDGDEANVTQDDDSQGDELIEMDELETKIDLARAYIDMGDEDAAKTIAEEVLSKGNDKQKQEAQKIIDSL